MIDNDEEVECCCCGDVCNIEEMTTCERCGQEVCMNCDCGGWCFECDGFVECSICDNHIDESEAINCEKCQDLVFRESCAEQCPTCSKWFCNFNCKDEHKEVCGARNPT